MSDITKFLDDEIKSIDLGDELCKYKAQLEDGKSNLFGCGDCVGFKLTCDWYRPIGDPNYDYRPIRLDDDEHKYADKFKVKK